MKEPRRPNYMLASAQYSEVFEHNRWFAEIPFLEFPPDWEIQIIPPTVGAMVRFRARKNEKIISVYLDCYDVLGYVGSPYWEAYPVGEDTVRYLMKDWKILLGRMNREFNS